MSEYQQSPVPMYPNPRVRVSAEYPADDPATPNGISVEIDLEQVGINDITAVVAALSRVRADAGAPSAARPNGTSPATGYVFAE